MQIETSQKLMLSQVFSQMRLVLRNDKRMRIRALNAYVKAWKDYIAYNRNLMQANMAAIQFGKTHQTYTLKNVFDELRIHKETRKFEKSNVTVEEDINIAIVEAQQFNERKQEMILRKNKIRAGNIVISMLGK